MAYLSELRDNIRPLLAASIGTGSGLALFAYTTGAFSPFLIAQFHWSRAQFALIGITMFSTLLVLPLIGLLADRWGVRRVALLGAFFVPPCFIAYSMMQGPFLQFLTISSVLLAVGMLTGPVVYTRLIAENFVRARGLALTVVTAMPALVAIVLVPMLTHINQTYGWRTGYQMIAVWVLFGNLVAVWLMPKPALQASATPPLRPKTDWSQWREIARQPVFWLLFAAFLLCTLATPLHASQMNLMLIDTGLSTAAAAGMVSLYAFGTVLGRIGCGLALDRFAPARVAALSMALPALGFAMIASLHGHTTAIGGAMLLIGLSVGAENDLTSFLVARYFRLDIFSTTLSLVMCGVFIGGAGGSVLLSRVVASTGSFTPFLYFVAATILSGAMLFILLPKGAADGREGL